jgi:RND family efflux transporter MFP subunit
MTVKTIALCGLILAGAVAVGVIVFATEPSATRGGATKQTAMLVEVMTVARGTHRPIITATGTVEAERDVQLGPQVSGQVVERAPQFTPGGIVEQGDVLLRIEPADYRLALRQRESDLRQAQADLEIEMGRQDVARSDYELFAGKLADEKKALVLRKPQLDAAKVRVAAARAAVDRARLDLERTTIEAPFTAQVLTRTVDVGSRVAPGDTLARLVGLELYWVAVSVPLDKLQWIGFSGGEAGKGAEVRIRNRASWPEGAHRTGQVSRVVGALDDQTRLARVLVAIPDPQSRRDDRPAAEPSLMVGEFVEARIAGKEVANAIKLDRDHVRDASTVWVMEEGVLRIREVEIAVRDADHAYITGGLEAGEKLVISELATVTEGAELRVQP